MQQKQSLPEIVELGNSGDHSSAIMKLAQTYELGQPEKEYLASFPLDPHGRAISLTIVIWLLTLPIPFILFLKGLLPYPWIIIWAAAALLPTLVIWTIAFLLQRHRQKTHYQRVYVCTSVLLNQKLNTIEAIHWHHIETLNHDPIGNCQVRHNDGSVFLFSSPLQQLGDLCSRIEQAIIPHHLPQLLTTYREGLSIFFGPLRINQQGIGLTQKNVTLFSWDKIEGIERRFDSLILKLYDARALSLPLTAHELPRVNLALALIRAILEPAEQFTQELRDTSRPGGQRGKQTQKIQEQETDTQIDGTLTNIMGDPIG